MAFAALFSTACGDSHTPDSEAEPIVRLDLGTGASDSILELGRKDLSLMGLPTGRDTIFAGDVSRLLPPLDSVEAVIGGIKSLAAREFPNQQWHHTFATVWPYNQSIAYSPGGNLIIALNHYLGPDYPAYGYFPDYLRRNKRLEMLPVDVAETLLQVWFPFQEKPEIDATFLNHLLHQGAVAYAMKTLLPAETSLDRLLGLDPDEAEWLTRNEAEIWQSMIRNNIVYSTDPAIEGRLLRRAPASPLISASAPGLTARYIGLRIVESYVARHPDATLSTLLSPDFYNSNQSLIDSGYAPK